MLFLVYLAVFLLAATPFLEVVGVIPIGVAAGLPALNVTIVALLGNLATIWLLILLIDKFKQWRARRQASKGQAAEGKRHKRAAQIWKKYGLPGLAIISPFLIGSHLGAMLAMSFGGTKRLVGIWMTASIVAWSILAGIFSHYGVDWLFSQTGRDGFLVDFLRDQS
ncbi:DNA-binding protein [Xylanibacillus composti]|uniref:Small multi-drug export protein n=1 Tax=Xylanibacillus composti TaxID=1572762 RepID=A0A8J4H3E2_9BACL|nr:small multi-drug export protein [Xylanibacillus composti]MDT9726111.1 DNA-binding protein [Xylanibacillus composti]GIQ68742.1 hypothetical protein XYCOK13_15660 [Xylanibacillus composti]